jgi:RNA-directed DNA polymerase
MRVERRGRVTRLIGGQLQKQEEPVKESKPFVISKKVVYEAFQAVKSNDGAAGVDQESIAEFERNLENNLYKLWNRMSSGTYFPPAVRAVEIPKSGGRGVRVLGVPTVGDRVVQTVVKKYLEPDAELVFQPDSYGYRPGRSALQAVGVCRERCWRYAWVIDLDIRAFFDTLDHELVMEAVSRHTQLPWVLLYVKRWLLAPLQRADGTLVERERGTPQGSAISPLLANLFMHYAFDTWMGKTRPGDPFERYCDDVVIHCRSQKEARDVLKAIVERLATCRLEVNLEKTRIVYCRNDSRPSSFEHERFDFLGFTFRQRRCQSRKGEYFSGFNPAISDEARKRIGATIRGWHLIRRSDSSLADLAKMINVVVRGWSNYYGRYFPSELYTVLKRLNNHLLAWARRKYKRMRYQPPKARQFLDSVARREPKLFAHWELGLRPTAG